MKYLRLENSTCLPICKRCEEPIEHETLQDERGNYWHLACMDIVIVACINTLDTIIQCTQDNNAKANSTARKMLKVIR